MPSVKTTAVQLGSGTFQNLGPDPVYLGDGADVTTSTGVKVAANTEVTVSRSVFGVSEGTSDVRQLFGGAAFSTSAAVADLNTRVETLESA